MSQIKLGRRPLLAAAATSAGLAAIPGVAEASPWRGDRGSVRFSLNASTLDGGEQVVSLTLDTGRFGRIDPASITANTFTVHAKATSPIPLAPGDMIFSEYDLDRAVTSATVTRHGDVVLNLATVDRQVGGGTLGYILSAGRNIRMTLTYTIKQNAPIRTRSGRELTFSSFTQGRLVNPEVDVYRSGVSGTGMNYRLFIPKNAGGHHYRHRRRNAMVVWLHGGGEGGPAPFYDNQTPLRANRGALGFSTPEAQAIFGGAYVLVPQCPSAWMLDGPRFAPQVKALIDEISARYGIDSRRITVAGCSNGGYMALAMTSRYASTFAASVPICPGASEQRFTDAELASITTPTWLVASADDTVLPPAQNFDRAVRLVPGNINTLYQQVVWNGIKYPGHWSWIYVARNNPTTNGVPVWQWMANKRLAT